jgi:putative heme-binding domain-containing protein
LPILDGAAAQTVLARLAKVPLAPEEPEYFRQVILSGLRLKEEGAAQAIALLEHWAGEERGTADDPWDKKLAAWQAWFSEQHPNEPPAKLPAESELDKWKYADLAELLTGKDAPQGLAEKGALAYEKALCNRCHKLGGKGESYGPDLTTVTRRFTTKEILEAVMFPAQTVSDQYAAKQIVTKDGRTLSGFAAPGGPGELVLIGPDGRKTSIKEAEIDEIIPTKRSPMPAGLLNQLSEQEIVDLFAYIRSGGNTAIAEKPKATK